MINSPVFEGMFLNNTEERRTGKVKIKDVSAEVMQLLIGYFNSGKIACLDKYAEELYIAADKYAIEKLQVRRDRIRPNSALFLENLYRLHAQNSRQDQFL
jgi:hypothetical protein